MFQLIVAVISIALVAALAIASIFYGGDAFNQGSLKANVTTLVNGGQQISGAQALYKTEHAGVSAKHLEEDATATPPVTADEVLVGEYLNAVPGISGAATGEWNLTTDGKIAHVPVLASNVDEICTEADRQAGNPVVTTWAETAPVAQFGCYTEAGTVSFGFKL